MRELSVRVGGRWLAVECLYGAVEMSTVWPGGSDQLTWQQGTHPLRGFSGGELAQAYLGPVCVWSGILNEPDWAQEEQAAQGLWRQGDVFTALDSGGNATAVPNTAIDQAITRGLLWTRPSSISSSAVDIDITAGPVSVAALLDAWANDAGKRWWVNPGGEVLGVTDSTTPVWQTLPLETGLGYALDNYASTLVGRYRDSGGYATAIRTNSAAESDHGHREVLVDLTPRGVINSTKANNILDQMLALGSAVPTFTSGVEVAYGDILSQGGAPAALEVVRAGPYLRVMGGSDLVQRKNSAMYLDVQIGRTQLSSDGGLTLTPMQVTGDSLTDQLAKAVNKKSA